MGEYVNSTTARFDKSHCSCGIVEVHHLPKNITQTVFSIANHLYNKANPRPAAFVLFSDVVDGEDERGTRLANALEKLNCGLLLKTLKEVNPKTGNTIRVWIWDVNHDKFRKWYQEELANRVSE